MTGLGSLDWEGTGETSGDEDDNEGMVARRSDVDGRDEITVVDSV